MSLVHPIDIEKAVTAAGTAIPLATAATYCKSFRVTAKLVDGDNVGIVFFGGSDVDKAAHQGTPLEPNDVVEEIAGEGETLNLADYYIDCETGNTDGVVGQYKA